MANQDSPSWPRLMPALEPWLSEDLDALPEWLRRRLGNAGFGLGSDLSIWDELTPQGRRHRADWRDCENDPALEAARVRSWELVVDHGAVRREIEEWESVAAPSAHDLAIKKERLTELRKRLAELDSQLHAADRGKPGDGSIQAVRRLDATGIVIQTVISELGSQKPTASRIWARLLDGKPVGNVTIKVGQAKNGSPAPIIAGKLLTRDALRKRLSGKGRKRDD